MKFFDEAHGGRLKDIYMSECQPDKGQTYGGECRVV